MPVAANAIIRATMTWLDFNDSKMLNTWHFRLTGTGTATNDDVWTAASGFMVDVYSNILPDWDDDMVSYELLVDEVSPTVGPWEVVQNIRQGQLIGGAIQGEEGLGNPLPSQTAALLRLGTLLRKHQGRKYFGGYTEAANDDTGRISALVLTRIAAAGTDVLLGKAVPNAAINLDVVIPNMLGFATNDVITTSVGPIWRSQRRRQQFVGI